MLIFIWHSFTALPPISRLSPRLKRFVLLKKHVIAVLVCNVAKFFLSVLDGVKAVDDSFTHEEIEKVLVEKEK